MTSSDTISWVVEHADKQFGCACCCGNQVLQKEVVELSTYYELGWASALLRLCLPCWPEGASAASQSAASWRSVHAPHSGTPAVPALLRCARSALPAVQSLNHHTSSEVHRTREASHVQCCPPCQPAGGQAIGVSDFGAQSLHVILGSLQSLLCRHCTLCSVCTE